MLNSMADRDFDTAMDNHAEWGLAHLDLKGGVYGKDVIDLTDEEADRVASEAAARGLSTYCMSTTLFHDEVEKGEDHLKDEHFAKLDQTIAVARILKPTFVRLLGAKTEKRSQVADATDYLKSEHAWLLDLYRAAVEKVSDAGFQVTIENECHDCVFSTPEEIVSFFDVIDCGDAVSLTWDVQNLWQMGTFPSLDAYATLKPLISYYHVKGGLAEFEGGSLKWRSSLEDASWPVEVITRQVVSDGVSPVICLNSSHGERKDGYDYDDVTKRDLDYMRQRFGGEL